MWPFWGANTIFISGAQLRCFLLPNDSPSLASSDYHLSKGLEIVLGGQHFTSNVELEKFMENYLWRFIGKLLPAEGSMGHK